MRVRFLNLDLNLMPEILALGYSRDVNFHLDTNVSYTVYGITRWRSVLHYLVVPDNILLPSWYPARIFEIIDKKVPDSWFFEKFPNENSRELEFLLGYEELVFDEAHYTSLIEREVESIKIFMKRKFEIEID